ncbi:MAG: ABC transporter ATP-binding protein [Gemmatimonadaceae bacterium]
MSETASQPGIVFDDVAKRFRRGHRADSLRELLPAITRRLTGRANDRASAANDFWALQGLSFSVKGGEVLGVIGPNGAGKSTILRLVTRILRPDRGSVLVNGRVGALIELAAGFHPELTGRENVFLQGAIMGMSRSEIARRFDEIIDFAGIGEFLDTPVKHYSNGMNARLGFAIAAHFEADVLLIDEVLAVGDRAFQARAFEKLQSEVRRGIPIIMVSHQLDRIAALCDRAILLSGGRSVFEGSAEACIAAYVEGVQLQADPTKANCPVVLTGLALQHQDPESLRAGDRVALELQGEALGGERDDLALGVRVWRLPEETRLAAAYAPAATLHLPASGCFAVQVAFSLNLAPGDYRLQAVGWKLSTLSEWTRGPAVLIKVARREGSMGVFLDPELRGGNS